MAGKTNITAKGRSKPKDVKGTLKGLWGYLGKYKNLLIIAVILSVLSNAFALIGPELSGRAIDAIGTKAGQADFSKIFRYCGMMVIFYVISSAMSYILSLIMTRISQNTSKQMREDVFNHLTELPVGYFDRNLSGDIISRISYDIDVINTSLSNDLVQICTSVITVAGSFIMMLSIEPGLVIVVALMIPVSVFYTKYMTGKTRPLFSKRSAKLGELNGFVEEMVSGQKTIRAYAGEEITLEKFDRINGEAAEAYYDADYYGSMVGPTVNFINNISLTLVTVFGAVLYLYKKITLGNISSFVLYSRKFSGPINEAANIMSELQSALAAAERVFRVLNEKPETQDIEGAMELSETAGEVRFDKIAFGYTQEKTIIKNLSMKAESGSMTAIVGKTGAGKTTIINLLMRFYDPDEGFIYIDDNECRQLTRNSLRKAYAMVLQDTWLFGGTIFENIAYGREGATMEEVVEAAKAARIHSFIEKLPEGYNTVLTEDGVNMSKGQKQLLTIARAMLLDAKMLILDEATSNVDTRTEIKIQEAMRKLMTGKTCFVIAHRLSTIQDADTILVVDDGNVIEQGNHAELMAKKGYYYNMYASQFE